MANYQDWNSGIYKFYFGESNNIETLLFSIDKNAIFIIGETINVSKDFAIENFCKCVINHMRANNGYRIPSPDEIVFPYYTAILAFFIYIASTMGESKDFGANAYWKKLEIENNLIFPINNRKNLAELFIDFAKKISEKEEKEYSFDNYFKHWTNIGFPMTQAMITEKDYRMLTQRFDNIKNESEIYSWDIENDKNFKDYSLIMQRVVKKEKNQWLSKILSLYRNWDGNVLEIDENNYKRSRKFINLLYAYSESRGQFQYYYTADARSDYEDIQFPQITLRKEENSKYYQKIQIEERNVSLKMIPSYSTNYKNLPIQRKDTEYIKLKEENGYFIEQTAINGIKEGDRFSIIATEQFFQKHADEIESVTDDNINWNAIPQIEGTNLCLLHNICATPGRYDNDFVAFNPTDKIRFKKGLKSGNGNYSWIEGAEPIIELNDIQSVKIDGIREKNQQKIDLRNKYKDINREHIIELDKSNITRTYNIVPIEKIVKSEISKCIYHIIDGSNIECSTNKVIDKPIVSGAYIDNINSNYYKLTSINNKKLSYILERLKNHKNLRQYEIPDDIKEILDMIINYCNNSNREFLSSYLEENRKIDNYICIYLNRMKEVIYE